MNKDFHGKSIEEIVDLRFKEWEYRQARDRRETAELKRRFAERAQAQPSKTTPPPPAPEHFVAIKKWLHDHHVL